LGKLSLTHNQATLCETQFFLVFYKCCADHPPKKDVFVYLAHCEERPLENQCSAVWITLEFPESLLLTLHLPLIIFG